MSKTSKKTARVQKNEPTVAIRLATLFDAGKDTLVADMRKPVESSRSKQVGIVGGLIGVGAALGVAFS